MADERRRKRDAFLDEAVGGGAEVGVEVGVSALAEFPPVALACGVVVGIGLLGFLAWKGFSRIGEKKNIA